MISTLLSIKNYLHDINKDRIISDTKVQKYFIISSEDVINGSVCFFASYEFNFHRFYIDKNRKIIILIWI